jgi:hypothetical protein
MSSMTTSSSSVGDPMSKKKQLVIKPFKMQPQLPVDFATETWRKLQLAVSAIYNRTTVEFSKEELCQVSQVFYLYRCYCLR